MPTRRPDAQLSRAHRRLARALEGQYPVPPARELARHWLGAGSAQDFARWALPAADEAGRAGDHRARADVLSALLARWDVPGVPEAAGAPWASVALELVRALRLAGSSEEAVTIARASLERSDVSGPDRAALLIELAAALTEQADPAAARLAVQALTAVRELPDDAASTRLLALAAGTCANFIDDGTAATAVRDASRRAERWGLDDVIARSDTSLGALLTTSDPDAAAAAFARAHAAAGRLESVDPGLLLRFHTNAGDALRVRGRADAAAALATAGLTWAVGHGFTDTSGAHLAATLVDALVDAGRYEEAGRLVDTWLPRAGAARERWWLLALGARVRLLVGDVDSAHRTRAVIEAEAGASVLPVSAALAVALLRCELLAATMPGATTAVALAAVDELESLAPVTCFELLILARSSVRPADGARPPSAGDDPVAGAWARVSARVHPEITRPWAALERAWRSSGDGPSSEAAWDDALAETRGRVPVARRVEALVAAARDAADHGRSGRARALVAAARDAVGEATSRWEGALAEVERHARPESAQPWELLSPREQDVLRLLATGATNDRVASTLGISPRTVEVHVGHLFRKLGATSRGGAVSAAVRRGLLREDDLRERLVPDG